LFANVDGEGKLAYQPSRLRLFDQTFHKIARGGDAGLHTNALADIDGSLEVTGLRTFGSLGDGNYEGFHIWLAEGSIRLSEAMRVRSESLVVRIGLFLGGF
jgi:hypothetical protein